MNPDDATANQPATADDSQTNNAESMVRLLSPNEDEQATSHSPSCVSDSNSHADVLSGDHFLAQPTLVAT